MPRGLFSSRRRLLAAARAAAVAALAGDGLAVPGLWRSGYVPDGTAGLAAAFRCRRCGCWAARSRRTRDATATTCLLFVASDLLRAFRLNFGQQVPVQPCGGWESPDSEVRGYNTGHLMSGLALTYANSGNQVALEKGRYLAGVLASLQALVPSIGYSQGYLSAFPESFFGRLGGQGRGVPAVADMLKDGAPCVVAGRVPRA